MLAGACCLAAYAPHEAAACGAPMPGLTSSTPADGDTYPSNAALLFDGYDIALDGIKVTVDGVGATLNPGPGGFATLSAFVDPEPAPGQTVVITGSFCPDFGCPETVITFTAGAPDEDAPLPDMTGFFGVFDHGDFMSSGGDCQFDSDMTFYLHVPQTPPAAGEAPQRISARWQPNGQGGFGGSTLSSAGDARIVMSVTTEALAGADPQKDVCFTVEVSDAAGNFAVPFDVCPACYFRKDDAVVDGPTPEEPAWVDADAIPGSACEAAEETTGATSGDTTGPTTGDPTGEPTTGIEATGTGDPQSTGEPETSGATSGDQDDDGKGCACNSEGGGPGGAALAVLALIGLRRRRAMS